MLKIQTRVCNFVRFGYEIFIILDLINCNLTKIPLIYSCYFSLLTAEAVNYNNFLWYKRSTGIFYSLNQLRTDVPSFNEGFFCLCEKSLRLQSETNKPVNWKPTNLPTVFSQMSQVWTHPVSGAKQSPPKGSGKPTQVMLWRRRSGGRSHVKVWSLQLSAVSSGELHLHRWTSWWRVSSSGDSLASWR